MLKQYFLKRKEKLIYATVLNTLFILAYNLMFYPRFHSDLDILMQSAVYGVSGIASSYVIYSNILLGKLLTILVSIMPMIPWYIVFHYVLVFVSLFVITYITINRNKSMTGKVLATVIVAFVGYECYVEPNYMKTAVLLCVCAAYLLLYAYETKKIIKADGVIVFAVLSSMVCFSAFIISAIVGFGIVCVYCLYKGCNKKWKIIITTTLASVIIIVAGARMFDNAMYMINNREAAINYRESVEKVFGYGIPDYSKDMLDKYNLDELHYSSISQGLFFDQDNNVFELLKNLSEEKRIVSFDMISKFFRMVPISLFETGMLYYLIVFSAVLLLIGKQKKLVLGTIVMLFMEYFLLFIFNAWKYEWISFMVMLPISLVLLIGAKNAEVEDKDSLIVYIIVLGLVLYSGFSSTMISYVRQEGTDELLHNVQADKVHMVDMVEYLRLGSVYEVYDRVMLPQNIFLMNGAYGLMEEFVFWVQLDMPEEGVEYDWFYNPSQISTTNLFLH